MDIEALVSNGKKFCVSKSLRLTHFILKYLHVHLVQEIKIKYSPCLVLVVVFVFSSNFFSPVLLFLSFFRVKMMLHLFLCSILTFFPLSESTCSLNGQVKCPRKKK